MGTSHLFENPKVADFCSRMSVPRKALRCEVYGTVRAIVDKAHATNILKKVFPTITSKDLYHALSALQNRLDD